MNKEKISSQLLRIDQKSSLTSDGRIIRYADIYNGLDIKIEQRFDQTFHAWQIERIFRRDFNFLSNRIFKKFHDQKTIRVLCEQIQLIVKSAERLQYQCEKLAVQFNSIEFERHHTIPVRLITPECAMLFRALVFADETMGRLNFLVKSEKINIKQANDLTDTYFSQYYACKNTILEK